MTNTYIWSWIRFQLQVLIRFCRKIWTFMLAHSSCSCFSNNFKCANSCESGICFLGSDYSKHNTMYITPPDLVKQLIPFSVPTCKESMRFAKKKEFKVHWRCFLGQTNSNVEWCQRARVVRMSLTTQEYNEHWQMAQWWHFIYIHVSSEHYFICLLYSLLLWSL